MPSAPLNPGREVGKRFLKIQFITIIVISILVGLWSGLFAAFSAFLGGLVGFLANAYVVYRLFRYAGARHTAKILQSFFLSEGYKIGISVLGLGLLFWSQKFVAVAVFIGYIASLAAYWCFPFISEKTSANKKHKPQ